MSGTCPCGRLGSFGQALAEDACCGPYLAGAQEAPEPESLMRSRYTAFVRGDEAYLRRTWDPATRPDRIGLDPATRWLGLDVHEATASGDDGVVEFTARFRDDRSGAGGRLHERSRFRRTGGAWRYVDGDHL